ncbi:MAG: glycosyltransferase family 4 protein [Candidatus Rokuibacteriota bacterium]
MRILVLTHNMQYPIEDGQSLRIYHYVRHLRRTHSFVLVTFGVPPHPEPIRDLFEQIWTVPRPGSQPEPLSLRKIARAISVDHAFYRDPAMEDLICRTIREERFDVVWASGWDMTAYTSRPLGLPVLADVVDEGFVEYSRELLRSRRAKEALLNLRHLFVNVRWERKYFRHASACLVVSTVDARWLRRFVPGVPVHVVENGVDAEYFRPAGEPEEHPSIIFEGNMSFPPNVDAACYLAREILPLVRQDFPNTRLYLVGRDPDPAVRALEGCAITVTGRVPDVRPYLARAALFVCPMRRGAGIKNKLLQAWAMAKATVATPVACGGLRIAPGENILVARGAKAIACETVRLLSDEGLRRRMGAKARQIVLEHYSWEAKAAELERVLKSVAQSTPRVIPEEAFR